MSTVPEDLIPPCCAPHPGGVEPVAAAGNKGDERQTASGLIRGGVPERPLVMNKFRD